MLDELQNACRPGMIGGFLPGVKQIANVAALPGIVHKSIGLPDVHSGYGFAIGSKPPCALGPCSLILARVNERERVQSHRFRVQKHWLSQRVKN